MDTSKHYKLVKKNEEGNVMEAAKIIDFERFNNSKFDNDKDSEWDIISNLFSSAAKRKNLSKSDMEKIANEVKTEVKK